MIIVRPLKGTQAILTKVQKIQRALTPSQVGPVLERVAQETFRHVVEATPKKWTGQVRRSWRVLRPSPTLRVVSNANKIMRWLEEGTANQGTGWIYPTEKKVLFVPLTRRAMYGYKPGLKFGVDYILRVRVRGIRPRRIVAAERGLTAIRLKAAMKEHIRQAIA